MFRSYRNQLVDLTDGFYMMATLVVEGLTVTSYLVREG